MTRSPAGICCASAFSMDVFPDPVPPLIKMLYLAFTACSRKSAASSEIASNFLKRSIVIASFGNFLIVTIGPFSAIGASTTLTREPSGSLASTIGFASFTIRLDPATICCTTSSNFCLDANRFSSLVTTPAFSIKICCAPLIIISVISSSSIKS